MPPLIAIRQHIFEHREALKNQYKEGNLLPEDFLHQHSQLVDQGFAEVIKAYPLPEGAALCAVGGYGRDELYPFSDIDILLLLAKEPSAADKERLETLVQSFWDLGLDIGASVRTIKDCLNEAKKDITIETSLLECRYLLGNRALVEELHQKFMKNHNPQDFFLAKQLEFKQRYARYNNTPYALEPNCKESPGALRDIQLIHWLALSNQIKGSWQSLVDANLMTDKEAEVIKKTEHSFKRFRIELHLIHNKRDDRVLFHVQPRLAEVYGYTAQAGKRPSEMFMQDYYGAARMVNLITHFMLQNFKDYLFPNDKQVSIIDEDFQRIGQLLDIRHDDAFEKNPSLLLKAFLVLQQHSELEDFSVRTQRLIWGNRKRIDAAFRANPVNQDLFLEIVKQPRGIVHTFRRLSKLKILPRYIPSWSKIVGQMQHDLFHVYTVDQHTLQVIRNMRRFTMPEYAQDNPLAAQLIADFDKSWLLYIAALFHDIAKGRGGDHSTLGAVEVRQFAELHRLAPEDVELLEFLVANHLVMSNVAQKKDLSDPEVIKHFSETVKDRRHLVALYLLTIADIRGTSPKVWNAWKGQLLQNLFQSTSHLFAGDHFDRNTILSQRKAEADAIIKLAGLSDEQRDKFWSKMDVAYFLRTEASDIAWHTRTLYSHIGVADTVVKARPVEKSEHIQIAVFTRDKVNLFERIAVYFYLHNINILDARIHTNADGYALDSFSVSSAVFQNPRDFVSLIETDLAKSIHDELPSEEMIAQRPTSLMVGADIRRSRTFPIVPSVELVKDEYGSSWLLSIVATDSPGILYHLAHIFNQHRINLHMAKIMTLGERAEDVFVIDSPQLDNEKSQLAFERDILDMLNRLTKLK
ncbi:[protein-PII] uridylyltransferase [Pelistega europaea]|uniref:Bifunctional uridylyltransferase/uridylyl-removing enzyme n=1 Tax=Pelistega europaea TaxID=106147 RepID=A0A7Y4L8S0_9BURK|nr:[protein-PII] uridylyltransferase [Pelistega europaea]NOL48983.1 [protein-PII] uridylyltransferase [Pelistega europaea]